ncbi:SLC13 family permease [Paeniglutamicibacter sp. ZC-3]|uniref:SLC13 family permease n=1 Tax=Paeniglutamicibacter sp. ZC-3 TaxID=2986919 RepID=UPI0021F7A561|nr:SLC13 family permease [Paeniglutamicibacter sp. ZC-3]MCV9996192.1 SLC13 family permease [Paeniglutamicibacter sp. ZC-3]
MRAASIGGLALALGLIAICTGSVPIRTIETLVGRVAPIILFLITISIVVNLCSKAGLFTWLATSAARLSKGRNWLLWITVILLGAICTAFLSLDTTAVLLTPIVVSLAIAAGINPVPFAFTTVWLANIGSLFLPVSNLTNLLALEMDIVSGPADFLRATFLPALAAVVVTALVSYVLFRKDLDLGGRHCLMPRGPAADKRLLVICGVVLGILVLLLATSIPYWITTSVAALVLIGAFSVRNRPSISFSLVPWGIILLAAGLMFVVPMLHDLSANQIGENLAPGEHTGWSLLGISASGVFTSNIMNNLPAYLLLEPLATSPISLVALLIGTNAGPLLTPWASLANLLWHDQLHRVGIRISWKRFCLLGILVVPGAVGIPLVVAILASGR